MFLNILKSTLRLLLKNKLQSFINITGLALGLFTVFLTMLWIGYHYRFDTMHENYEQIHAVKLNFENQDGEVSTYSGAPYKLMDEVKLTLPQINEMTRVFSSWRWPALQCFKTKETEECTYRQGIFSDSSFFKVFSFPIVSGASNPLLSPSGIAISENLAQRLYANEDPVGQTYLLDNHFEVEILAVFEDIPKTSSLQFDFVAPMDVFLKLRGMSLEQVANNSFNTYVTVSPDDASLVGTKVNEMEQVKESGNEAYFFQPISDVHLYSDFENGQPAGGLIDYVRIFLVFGAFILLMTVVNFINMTTATSSIRGREVGVRKVTGATRGLIAWQFMLESFIKVVLGAALAITALYYFLPMANAWTDGQMEIMVNQSSIITVLTIVFVCTILSGSYPAFLMSGFNVVKALKNAESTSSKWGLRRVLTAFQIAFSIIILLVSTIIYLQVDLLKNKDLGYDKNGIMVLEPTYAHVKNYDAFKNAVLANHQIKNMGVSNTNMTDASYVSDRIEWQGKLEEQGPGFKLVGGDAGLVDVLALEFIDGSNFNLHDSINEVILTQDAAQYMGFDDPIGQDLTINNQPATVAGVVNSFNTSSLHDAIMPTIIYKIRPQNAGTMYIRMDAENMESSIAAVEKEYKVFDSFFSMRYQILSDMYEEHYRDEILVDKLAKGVMLISLIIAVVGIFGLSSFNIVRRYKEIGIRKVFGARVSQVTAVLTKDFLKLGLTAGVIAIPMAWWISSEWLASFAYKVDIPIFLFIGQLVLVILFILLLSGVQTLWAASTNPAKILKED